MRAKVATVNDDFTDKVTDVPYYAARRHVVMAQEGKNTDYRRVLSSEYGVRQGNDVSKAGAAVIWQKRKFKYHDSGYHPLIRVPKGVRMEDRWIAWVDLERGGKIIRYASAHNAPERFSFLWDEAEKNLRRFVADSPYPVVIGMDANRVGGPRGQGRIMRWKGKGIDGFLFSCNLRLYRVLVFPFRRSDHRAVRAVVRY